MPTPSPDKPRLLIVEDDPTLRKQLQWALMDHPLSFAEDQPSALAAFKKDLPQVVILDLGLPPEPNAATVGLEILRAILTLKPTTKVIVSSGNEERANAIEAIRSGAYDFYPKPVDQDVLRVIIDRAWNSFQLEEELLQLRDGMRPDASFFGVVSSSPDMQKVCTLAERVANSAVSVVITGETGTGKDMMARAIHAASPRASGPFIAINCAAIPHNLLESELFGHEKGAFTGAHAQVVGKVEQANKGTLFLDEIGDMPIMLQSKLLRFLQDRMVERIGGRKPIPVDVRVLAATNQDLALMMKEGTFREDLYFRLNEVSICIPPLRERPGDAVLIAAHLLKKAQLTMDKTVKGFTREALECIEAYPWPGNVRELENRIRRAVVMADQGYITVADLDLEKVEAESPEGAAQTLREVREDAERRLLSRTLALTGNNIQEASRLMGVSRPTLYALMKTLNFGKSAN
jgi:two-component system, NtrC family, response regulator